MTTILMAIVIKLGKAGQLSTTVKNCRPIASGTFMEPYFRPRDAQTTATAMTWWSTAEYVAGRNRADFQGSILFSRTLLKIISTFL